MQLSAAESRLIEPVDPAAMLERVKSWSAINTGTGNLAGLSRQADLLADAFSALPGQLELTAPAPVITISDDGREREIANGHHLVLRVRPSAARRILLTGHMDTVFAPDHPFQSVQWVGNGSLNGPGVADMKGGIAVMLAALTAIESTPAAPAVGYDVLINSDEETGSLSSAALIAELSRGKLAALTYEPSALPDGTLAGARGGSGNYSITIRGRPAHAGRNPQDGRNAIVAAAALTLELKTLERAGLTINPARIGGGSANNVVPDLAILRFNIRPAEAVIAERFLRDLKILMDGISKRYEVLLELNGGLSRRPKPLDARAEDLFNLVRNCGAVLEQTIRWQPSGGVCDGNNIAACGVPVVDTMGVRGGAIHSPGEFLIVSSLEERAALSALVIHRLAQGDAP